ncbi:hypothetical protein GOQ29_10380 [Clostridium sp. D2Q-14]|uniref:hypothetical protein n=1 Tax=Anaeromonas gelatinilytica TaxID=2683194 RepID=UPI00193B6C2A|nr:hypothetical protein [Anaeromonas gelatinilytica]MBS4536019.1 hypothetical protein [Anaeromonas gelatinilytica]
MKDLNIIGLPLKCAMSKINNDLSITIFETKGTNNKLNNKLTDLRVVKYNSVDKSIKIIVCAF